MRSRVWRRAGLGGLGIARPLIHLRAATEPVVHPSFSPCSPAAQNAWFSRHQLHLLLQVQAVPPWEQQNVRHAVLSRERTPAEDTAQLSAQDRSATPLSDPHSPLRSIATLVYINLSGSCQRSMYVPLPSKNAFTLEAGILYYWHTITQLQTYHL